MLASSCRLGASADPVCALAAHQHQLLVARASGLVAAFGLPGLQPGGTYLLRCRPAQLAINCDGSRAAVVDFNGVMSFLDLAAPDSGATKGEHLPYERKARTAACTC